MPPKVIIAADSFKGSLPSQLVGEALAQGLRKVVPSCEVDIIPIADGGEGSAETLTRALHGEMVAIEVCDPLGRPITARYGIARDVALIDFASAAGLTLLTPEERNPLIASSRGVGEMISDALLRGCRHIVLGLGGSATNDCATGLLAALGCRFLDRSGVEVKACGANLEHIAAIDCSALESRLQEIEITLAADVLSPLCGERGATHTFSPQKGATPEMVALLERGVCHFAHLLSERWGAEVQSVAGAGAAGGAGAGLTILAGARLRRGIEVVLEAVDFTRRTAGADLVITGEGRLDSQTLLGKAPCGVLHASRSLGKRVVAVGGGVRWCPELEVAGFCDILAATPEGMPLEEAMLPEVTWGNLRLAGEKIALRWLAEAK